MDLEELTPREIEVVQCLSQGMNNKEIAATLIISERTVQSHLAHIADKWGTYNRTQIVIHAIGVYVDLEDVQAMVRGR